jgi:glyoxylase-like metal-dependent hydrolase (beta-lactamase superfamily II)
VKNWNIAPLLLGKGPRDKSFFTYLKDPGVKIEIGMIAWLVFNEDERIMIDTGPSDPSKTAKFHKPFSQTPEENLVAQLKRFHTDPDEIKMVINTHLHWDHCYGNALFKKARFFVQKREMDYARDPLPSQIEMYEAKQEGITPPFEGMEFELIDGDAELTPGIRVMLTPGHTAGIQAVCIETREGVYVIPGDNIPLFDNIRVPDRSPFIPSGILTDLRAYFQSLGRIKKLDATILPGHDLRVLEKTIYP